MPIHRDSRGDSALVEDNPRTHCGTASPIVVFKEVLARAVRHAAFRVEARAIAAEETGEDRLLTASPGQAVTGGADTDSAACTICVNERERRAGRNEDSAHRNVSPESGYHPTPSNSLNRRSA